ncbi:MAG TPA: glycosyltransferase [Chitinispirillaceae bacterium]|nr:glycosyltransferase [Chitinispirillaceae bacterium]
MISIITCSQKDPSWDIHVRNIRKTAGVEIEYVRIDNRTNRYNICSAYNEGVKRANGDILVFMHEDVFFCGRWLG